jgi:hypothetical protein
MTEKPLRWTRHAEDRLPERFISMAEAQETLRRPERVDPDANGRLVYKRRFLAEATGTELLALVIVEETGSERVVVTVITTTNFAKHLGERR